MAVLRHGCLSTFVLAVHAATQNWREQLVPSFEADHSSEKYGSWLAPGAPSFRKVSEVLHQFQADHNITEDLLSSLPGLPHVTDFNMTMSDGTHIWTRLVNPWPYTKKKPACLVRSPYGSLATQNLALIFLVLNGHAAVMQEDRGTWRSGGVFDLWRGSAQDASDTIGWIARQDWSSGEVYSMGASADGIAALEEVIAEPKELHGQWFIWTTGNGHNFVYPGGAYRKDLMFGYLDSLKSVTRAASTDLVLPATEQNEADNPWWYNLTDCGSQLRPMTPPGCRFKNAKWPVVLSSAWWDLFHETMLDFWHGMRAFGDATWRDDHVLIVSPLGHNIAGKLNTGFLEAQRLRAAEVDALIVGGELTSEFWRWSKCSDEWSTDNECKCQGRVRFGSGETWSLAKEVRGSIKCDTKHFGDPLPGIAKECQCQQATGKLRQRIGRVNLFVMGGFGSEELLSPGNYWTSLDDFPSFTPKALYLGPEAVLSGSLPTSKGSVLFTYDPLDPAPMIGGNNLPFIGNIEYSGSADQTLRENRSDVVVFDSAPLTEHLAVVGAISATLFVSSSAPDTDFFVTVSDMHPDGKKSMLVRYGMQRMRWRHSETTKDPPLIANNSYETYVNMGYTAYVFPKGHRIRVSVSSAAEPYFNPTSNTGNNDMTTKTDKLVAQNSVNFAPDELSRLTLPVVSIKDIPKNPHFTAVGPFMESTTEQILV